MAYKEDLQKFYVGFYGRPADPDGLAFWNDKLEGISDDAELGFSERFAMLKEDFAGEGGETTEYDLVMDSVEDNAALVDLIYQNLFGRDATADDDRDFWVNQLDEGESTIITIVNDVICGIEEDSADEAIFMNRLEVANYFTDVVAGKAYGWDNIEGARTILYSVTDDEETVTSGKTASDTFAGVLDEEPDEPDEPVEEGEAFYLEVGRDNLDGTVGNNTFYADAAANDYGAIANSLNTGDRLDGNGGYNTLDATVLTDKTLGGVNMTPIRPITENIQDVKLNAMLFAPLHVFRTASIASW